MQKTERDRLDSQKITSDLSQKCSLSRKEETGKTEVGSQVTQEREVKLHGQLRPLVPFFIPGEETNDGDLKINDTLRVPSQGGSKVSREPKDVIVRTWDREHGFFEEAVHRVTENSNSSSSSMPKKEGKEGSSNSPSNLSAVEVRTKLLTPDNIFARVSARKQFISPIPGGVSERKKGEQKSSPNSSFERDVCRELNFSEHPQKVENSRKGSRKMEQNRKYGEHRKLNQSSNCRHSSSPKLSHHDLGNSNKSEDNNEKGKKTAIKDYRVPDKPKSSRKVKKGHHEEGAKNTAYELNRRFAGSSYDTASPPPASLPLPSFVK